MEKEKIEKRLKESGLIKKVLVLLEENMKVVKCDQVGDYWASNYEIGTSLEIYWEYPCGNASLRIKYDGDTVLNANDTRGGSDLPFVDKYYVEEYAIGNWEKLID